MNRIPLVSICTLTFNHEKYISKAIESFLMQRTSFPFEIIIGEDCSTDGTKEIVNKYKKRYPELIKVITSERNVGIIRNSIRTVEACNGKYFAFCEGDDYWTDPLKLQKQVDYLEKHMDYGMVHTDVNHYMQEKGKLIKNYNKSNKINFPSGSIFEEFLSGSYFIKTATVMVRRELFLKAFNYELFEQKKWQVTDQAIWLDIAANSKIRYLDETTATYRLVEESASRTRDRKKKHAFHKSIYEIKFYFWGKYSKDQKIKKKLDLEFNLMLLGDAYKMGDIILAKKAITFFKQNKLGLPTKQKIKYWALQNGFIGLLARMILMIKNFFKR